MSDYFHYAYAMDNAAREPIFVYHSQGVGLYLELRRMANAMMYCIDNGLQFVLDSTRLAYAYRDGWSDYFQPCMPSWDPAMESRVRFHFMRDKASDEILPRGKIFWYRSERIRIGDVTIEGLDAIQKLLVMALFHLNEPTRKRVEAMIEALDLPPRFSAIQVRRGEKVINGEGRFHGAAQYLDALDDLAPDEGLFVMSDDFEAVREARSELPRRGWSNPVRTLVPEDLSGIHFYEHMSGGEDLSREDFLREETLRLLAETVICTRARRFIGADDTNVAHGLRFLHPDPGACTLIS